MAEKLEALFWQGTGPTVIVLDNAPASTRPASSSNNGPYGRNATYIYFFCLPYSPHLNIAETVWRHSDGGWLQPQDYAQADDLAYATNRCLANFGKQLGIAFRSFNAK